MSGEYSSPPCYAHEFETTDAQGVANADDAPAAAAGAAAVGSEAEASAGALPTKEETAAERAAPLLGK